MQKWLAVLLGLLGVVSAEALDTLTNAHLRAGRGILVGWSTNAVAGEVRFNSVESRLEVYSGSSWDAVGSGASGGGNVSFSNAWRVIYSDGATNVVELPLGPEGTVLGSSGEASAPSFVLPTVPLTNFVPLTAYERYRQVYYAAVRSTFYAKMPISSNIPYTTHPSYTNTYPIPGYDGEIVWGYVARGGADGASGAPAEDGTDGLDGFGYMRYGPWQADKGYAYDTNALVVVSYRGLWYDCIRSSTGVYPSAVGASNYWSASIYSAMNGTLFPTNLIFRGAWSSSETGYASNDVVEYYGNLFYVHTNAPGVGTAPAVDGDLRGVDNRYWDRLLSRGNRGAQGVAGRDGEVTHLTNIVQWTILDAGPSVVVTNLQDVTNRIFYFDYWVGGIVGGTGVYHWGASQSGGGTLTNETDPAFATWLGTNAYVKTEADPHFSLWLGTNGYLKEGSGAGYYPTNAATTNDFVTLNIANGETGMITRAVNMHHVVVPLTNSFQTVMFEGFGLDVSAAVFVEFQDTNSLSMPGIDISGLTLSTGTVGAVFIKLFNSAEWRCDPL